MGWIFRIVTLIASWMKLKTSVDQTRAGVQQASTMATGIQQKHTQESLEKAMQGDPNALYDLGERHYDGRGVPCDYRAAAEWFTKGAEAGHCKAQTNLGLMYLLGKGVPKDRDRATHYLKAAAAQGDETASETLRKMTQRQRRPN